MLTIDKSFAKSHIPYRPYDAHKGTMGTLLAVCGSYGMAGAVTLCTTAALKSGLGLLKTALPKSIYPICAGNLPESVYIPLEETKNGTISAFNSEKILETANGSSAVVIGCGLGCDYDTAKIVADLLQNCKVPLIIDADGINCIARFIDLDILSKADCDVILTPHPGEMARLYGATTEYINSNREAVATSFASKHNVTVVLKGHNTLVASPDGRCAINTTGNAGMATGGSGDVLAGIISSLSSQGRCAFDAACTGVYIHGLAGDIASEIYGQISMLPTDLINCLHKAFSRVKI